MTGAGGELGRATAEILAGAGYTVAGVDRPRDSSAPPADAVSIDVVSAARDNRIAELMVRNRQVAERVSGVIARDRYWRASRSGLESSAGPVHVSTLTYCTTMTTCPSGLSVTVYQIVRPSEGR